MCVWVRLCAQSHATLCDPVDCSLPASSVHGTFQARILERVSLPVSEDLPNPGIELVSPALTDKFFTTEPPGKLCHVFYVPPNVKLLFVSFLQFFVTFYCVFICRLIKMSFYRYLLSGCYCHALYLVLGFPGSTYGFGCWLHEYVHSLKAVKHLW